MRLFSTTVVKHFPASFVWTPGEHDILQPPPDWRYRGLPPLNPAVSKRPTMIYTQSISFNPHPLSTSQVMKKLIEQIGLG